jgi:hypothetical protein
VIIKLNSLHLLDQKLINLILISLGFSKSGHGGSDSDSSGGTQAVRTTSHGLLAALALPDASGKSGHAVIQKNNDTRESYIHASIRQYHSNKTTTTKHLSGPQHIQSTHITEIKAGKTYASFPQKAQLYLEC